MGILCAHTGTMGCIVYVRRPVRFASDAIDSCTVDVLTEGSVYLLFKVGGGAQATSHPILCLGFVTAFCVDLAKS